MKSYSQTAEDLFATSINKNQPGFFIDIGSNSLEWYNNTKLLLENGWSGISVDVSDYRESFNNYRDSVKFIQSDATSKENILQIFNAQIDFKNYKKVPNVIDFLSLDIDDYTYQCLSNIPFEDFKFKCIAIEHDAYRLGDTLKLSEREFLIRQGYEMIATIFEYEDWWINPNLININEFNHIKKASSIKRTDGGASPEAVLELQNLIFNK